MRREDRELLADVAQINTALPAFALHVMGNTATPAEHRAVADRVIALGEAIRQRAENRTIISPESGDTGGASPAAKLALSALIDMTEALANDRPGLPNPASGHGSPDAWLE